MVVDEVGYGASGAGGDDQVGGAAEIGSLPPLAEATMTTLAVRKCAGRVRQLYQSSVADLFEQEVSTDLLKRRELLRRLDVVGLRLGECADALSDAMLKRSH
ncbi:hypothetical protein EV138_1535 [Kribbella voronezhensis]|uniref:Uncharacterized protein n=1 Tax=Kribbella voronezhensis TaxID=2512212 RepID=A0A4R7T9F8_9ACTN|nr:hypothetical protein [Kribbella voronezhensis]TDU87996.1 hypothetical protein EV138_1535 [Kribbella voronezhensis]